MPKNPLNQKNPLEEGEILQQEKSPTSYSNPIQLGPMGPEVTLETNQSGKIGSASPVTIKPLREPIADASPSNPEAVAPVRKEFIES